MPRKSSGDFVSGVNSEKTLSSFALSPHARGWFDLILHCDSMYENEQKLEAVFLHGRKLETGFASDHL
jgi:hypothetical protein